MLGLDGCSTLRGAYDGVAAMAIFILPDFPTTTRWLGHRNVRWRLSGWRRMWVWGRGRDRAREGKWAGDGSDRLEGMVACGGTDVASDCAELQCLFPNTVGDDGIQSDGDAVVVCASVCICGHGDVYVEQVGMGGK